MKSWAGPELRPAGPRMIARATGVEPAYLPQGSALSAELRPFSANDPSRLQSRSGLHRPGPAGDAEVHAPSLPAKRSSWCPSLDSNQHAFAPPSRDGVSTISPDGQFVVPDRSCARRSTIGGVSWLGWQDSNLQCTISKTAALPVWLQPSMSGRGRGRSWQGRRGSNPRPSVLETDTLPAELHPCRETEAPADRAGRGRLRGPTQTARPHNRPMGGWLPRSSFGAGPWGSHPASVVRRPHERSSRYPARPARLGARERGRTSDTRLFKPVLYQLSYPRNAVCRGPKGPRRRSIGRDSRT